MIDGFEHQVPPAIGAARPSDKGEMELKKMSRPSQTSETGLDADIQSRLGRELQNYYDKLVSEPLPDRLSQLLDQLDAPEGANQATAPNQGQRASQSRDRD